MDTKSAESSRQDAKIALPLEQKVIDTIVENMPLNLTCPRCEYEIPIESIIEPDSKYDRGNWIKLAAKIISIVKEKQ